MVIIVASSRYTSSLPHPNRLPAEYNWLSSNPFSQKVGKRISESAHSKRLGTGINQSSHELSRAVFVFRFPDYLGAWNGLSCPLQGRQWRRCLMLGRCKYVVIFIDVRLASNCTRNWFHWHFLITDISWILFQTNTRYEEDDLKRAQDASKNARFSAILAVVFGCAIVIFCIFIFAIVPVLGD